MHKAISVTRDYYNQHGQKWVDTKTNSFFNEIAFCKIIKLWPERAHILDIGCAAGIHVPLFLGIGRKLRYTGIDISRYFIKIAKHRYPQLTFIEGNIVDITKTNLKSGSFAGFFSGSTLQHIPLSEWDNAFLNIEKLVKKGGYGYISLPIAHPTTTPSQEDVRHFTILSEAEHLAYFKGRRYKIVTKGVHDGFTTAGIWRWYIIKLPS